MYVLLAGRSFVPVHELTESDFSALQSAIADLYHFEHSRIQMELLEVSRSDFSDALDGLDRHSDHWLQAHVRCTKGLLSYLAAFRLFLDQSRRDLIKTHGRGSELELYEDAFGQAQRVLPFQFIWDLRNYVQHCGLPFGKSKSEILEVDDSGSIRALRTELYCEAARLLTEYNGWSPQVRAMLLETDEILLSDQIEKAHDVVIALDALLVSFHLEEIEVARDVLETLRAEYSEHGELSIADFSEWKAIADESADDELLLSRIPIPFYLLQGLEGLRTRVEEALAETEIATGIALK